jgi:hypothetical protein
MRDPAGYDDAEPRLSDEEFAAGDPSDRLPEDDYASLEEIELLRAEIAEELSRRETELVRRERSLSEQLAALDREQRNSRFAEQAFEDRCQQRESELAAKEADLAHRLTRCEELIAELEEEQTALDADRTGILAQKSAIREAVLGELAAERQAVDAEREGLFGEKKEFRRRVEQHEKEMASARDELRKSWEVEREALRKQLTAKLATELSAERRAFEQERADWEDRCRHEQAMLEDGRVAQERLVERAKAEIERLRRDQEIEFTRRRRDLEAEIESQVRAAEAAFHKERAEWESARAAAESELRDLRADMNERRLAQEEALRASREEFEQYREEQLKRIEAEAIDRRKALEAERSEWASRCAVESERIGKESAALEEGWKALEEEQRQRRERVTAELAELRQAHDRELAAERSAFETQQEAARLALGEERAVMENRLHFQKEHLDRTREELEETRLELERRLQEGRAQAVALAEQFRLRQAHLSRFRQLLDDREQAIERERVLLGEARTQADEERRRETVRREGAEDAWLRDKEAEQIALKQLRDDLSTRAEQVAARQARLDTLRLELETTHRENLELRVALDETWVKLVQTAGSEKAKQQLQATRALVAEQFRQKEGELDRRRALLSEDATAARRQLDQLDARRKDLSEWLSESLSTLHRREEELKRWAATLDARESRSMMTATRWRDEKAEAEGVIRGLLKQLAEAAESEAAARQPAVIEEPSATSKRPMESGPHFRLEADSVPAARAAG